MKKLIKNIAYIFGPLLLGFLTSLLFDTKVYKSVNKPFLAPPSIVFPIAWSILYLLMGISLYLCLKDKFDFSIFKTFCIQLLINLIWPFLFFTFNLYFISAAWILLLLYFVSKMIEKFNQANKKAGYLQIPYFIWLIFALYLNIGVALLN